MANKNLGPVDHLFPDGVVECYEREVFSGHTANPVYSPVATDEASSGDRRSGAAPGVWLTFRGLEDNREYVAAQFRDGRWVKLQSKTGPAVSENERVIQNAASYPAPDKGQAMKAWHDKTPSLTGSSHTFAAGSEFIVYKESAFTDGQGPLGLDSEPVMTVQMPGERSRADAGAPARSVVAVRGEGDDRRFVRFSAPRGATALEAVLLFGRPY